MAGPARNQRDPKPPLSIDSRARAASRIAFALLLVLLGIWIAQDFLAPLGWAVFIAISTWPLYRRFAILFSTSRTNVLAPLLFTVLVGVILFLPVALATHRVAQESQVVAQSLAHYRKSGIPVPAWLPHVPAVAAGSTCQGGGKRIADAKSAAEWIGTADSKNDVVVTRAVGAEGIPSLLPDSWSL